MRVRSSERNWLHSRRPSNSASARLTRSPDRSCLGGAEQRLLRARSRRRRVCSAASIVDEALVRTRAVVDEQDAAADAACPITRRDQGPSTPSRAVVDARMRSSSVSIFRRDSVRTRAISASRRPAWSGNRRRRLRARARGRRAGRARSPSPRGYAWVAGSALSRRQTSKPSMPGIITSSRTMSHSPRSQSSSASAPDGGDHVEIFGREPRLEQLHVGQDVVDDQDARGHATFNAHQRRGRRAPSRGTSTTEIGLEI